MKNKRGFTLIELLAVIVILAIIALIASPIILNMINDARKNSAKSSALGYIDAIEYNNGFAQLGTADISGTYEEIKTGDVTTANQKLGSHLKGKAPTSGTVTIDSKGKVTAADFCINGYNVTYDGKDATVNGKCNGSSNNNNNNNNNEPQQPSVPEPVSFATDDWSTIAANTTSNNYHVGDEKEILLDIDEDGSNETYHLVIVNKTLCIDEESESACGMVIQFKELLKTKSSDDKKMNLTNTNVGGWPASEMRAYLNDGTNSIYNKLKEKIGDIIIDTKTVSGHGSTSGEENFTSNNDKLYLLSTKEVGLNEANDTAKTETRKLDYYDSGTSSTASTKRNKNKVGTETIGYWWLRTSFATDNTDFFAIRGGSVNRDATYSDTNISPAFRIGNEIIKTNKNNPLEMEVGMSKVQISDSGKYKLEVWGAQGGSTKSSETISLEGGYGSYSVGYINLNKNDLIYIVVGEKGTSSVYGVEATFDGGCNGGGYGRNGKDTDGTSGAGGGGATHIAIMPGSLSKLDENRNKILIVAGGGGGSYSDTDGKGYSTKGGHAGGYIGGSVVQIEDLCNSNCTKYNYPSGGTQENGGFGVTSWKTGATSSTQYVGTFGKGATGSGSYGGGGGGYYGGASGNYNAGGGGSGYLSSSLTDAAMYCYDCEESSATATKTIKNNQASENPEPMKSKIGNGYAKITYISE